MPKACTRDMAQRQKAVGLWVAKMASTAKCATCLGMWGCPGVPFGQPAHWQWLLVTLTAGVGGSLLSIGSAAGIALMGQARGHYTFMTHLKWTPVIALGYAASIWVHILINGS